MIDAEPEAQGMSGEHLAGLLLERAKLGGWSVAFRLAALRRFAGPEQVRAMFHLTEDAVAALAKAADQVAYIVLSEGCRHLIRTDGGMPALATQIPDAQVAVRPTQFNAALGRAVAIADLPDRPDCIGVSLHQPQMPIWLIMPLMATAGAIGSTGFARALLAAPPSTADYDLLPAVGLRHLGTDATDGGGAVAHFSHDTAVHLHAGLVSAHARTGHCNRFFVQGCEIDPVIKQGLKSAARARIAQGRALAAAQLRQTILSMRQGLPAMTEVPPAPQPMRATGDLVAMGMALWGMRDAEGARENAAAAQLAERVLLQAAPEGPYAFRSGGLPTATDSALVMLGMEPAPIACLAPFADPTGPGFLPQLTTMTGEAGTMRHAEHLDFWCQEDFPTTCLVRHLHRRSGQPDRTPLAHLEAWFPRRGGLYFAVPHLTDLALALALQDDPDGGALLTRLAAEVAASQEPQGHFGRFAPATSTAAAAIVLGLAGGHGRALLRAQIALLGLLDAGNRWPVEAPFHAAARITQNHPSAMLQRPGLRLGQHHLGISLYEDTARAVVNALALRALGWAADPDEPAPSATADRHPRYDCPGQFPYVGDHALRPYLAA